MTVNRRGIQEHQANHGVVEKAKEYRILQDRNMPSLSPSLQGMQGETSGHVPQSCHLLASLTVAPP